MNAREAMAALRAYRAAVKKSPRAAHAALAKRARHALLFLGGDPERASDSLKQYDHRRFGPFLGVSDEGSAAPAIREAAFDSPKALALGKTTPLTIGVAVDAERLGGIGEVAVGPDEWADIWLATIDRLLVTTNVGTRVNVRVFAREPRITITKDDRDERKASKAALAAAIAPFVKTPDGVARPRTVFAEIALGSRLTVPKRRAALRSLMSSIPDIPGASKKLHRLGLAARLGWGPKGRDAAIAAIDLASAVGIEEVAIDGVVRKEADEAISLAGLLAYLPPGLLGPVLRHAKAQRVRVRAANLPDTDTIARSVWTNLNTARSMGAHLGKFGCFPLTFAETEAVVSEIHQWLPEWSPAPVFFVDQGVVGEESVDVERDLMRGLRRWLMTVSKRGTRVVLVDTVDKAKGRKLLSYFSLKQIASIEQLAAKLDVRVLWAGGLGLADAYELGKLGVFGIYVTTAASIAAPVTGTAARDPALAAVKEPNYDAVLRTKTILEAGFLVSRLPEEAAKKLADAAAQVIGKPTPESERLLAKTTRAGWKTWLPRASVRAKGS